jgi:hypothetical protein
MNVYALLAVYLTAALSLTGGVVAALISLACPVGSEPSTPPPAKIASVDSAGQIIVEPRYQAFRYGPEINHGRSDTPVYARQQALKEARAQAPSVKIKRPRAEQRQMEREPGPSFGYAPSVPSSGH